MERSTPMELAKIKKIAAEIQEFPTKIDSKEQAKNAKDLLKKYALLSGKIERNVLIGAAYQKDLAKIRTAEFKARRRTLKENANSILQAKNNKNENGEKIGKKTAKTSSPKKASKAVDEPVAKKASTKKTVKKSSSKTDKSTTPKKGE